MEKEIVKSESTETKKAELNKKATSEKKTQDKKAVEKPTADKKATTEHKPTQSKKPNVDAKEKAENKAVEDCLVPAVAYDFRLSGEERKELLKEVKNDALDLKKDLVKTKFNTLSLKQIGKNKRMFALRHGNDVRIYINAAIAGRAGGAVVEQIEECDPKKKYIILRPQQVRLVFINEVGEAKETILEGIAAAEAVKQVEREEGILISELGKECPRWEKMTEPSRLRFVKEYLRELSEIPTEATEDQEEYITRKNALKEELKKAKKNHGKAERERAREIERLKKSREMNRPWEE